MPHVYISAIVAVLSTCDCNLQIHYFRLLCGYIDMRIYRNETTQHHFMVTYSILNRLLLSLTSIEHPAVEG